MVRALALWGLSTSFVAISLHSLGVAASSAVNVALKASFSSAPYLVELLETAGDENTTSYFPLVDRIADGYFDKAATDHELYELFVKTLRDDGHVDGEGLSSYNLALSLRTAAPRIEAHYQYYDTTVEPTPQEADPSCLAWVDFGNEKYCSPSLSAPVASLAGGTEELQFDRTAGNPSAPATILYADITSPRFAEFHKPLVRAAREGKSSYRIRHKKPLISQQTPVSVGGYGVELALKRTDYIVLDDRDAEISADEQTSKDVVLDEEEVADLKPLSRSELSSLGLKASSFIMQSENPLEMLKMLSQDFPRFSTAIAAHNVSEQFVAEHEYNRGQLVPSGSNMFSINGLHIPERQIDAFSLLDILRKERKSMQNFRQLRLTASQAIDLLAHKDIANMKADDESPRFDWRDTSEGGNVIIWLNDIEKDKRYKGWPTGVKQLLRRTYPGQLIKVRKDMLNVVFPVDLSNTEHVELVVKHLFTLVKRELPLRFGFVPLTSTDVATEQASIVYHLLDTYGISAAMAYLEASHASGNAASSQANFDAAAKAREARPEKIAKPLDEVLTAVETKEAISKSRAWNARLGVGNSMPPVFVNGAAIPRDDAWMQVISQRLSMDLQLLQRAVYEQVLTDDDWLPSTFLQNAALRRNTLIVPESEQDLKLFDVGALYAQHSCILQGLPSLQANKDTAQEDWAQLLVIADPLSQHGKRLLDAAADFRKSHSEIELLIVPSYESAEGYASIKDLASTLASAEELQELIDAAAKPTGDVSDADGSASIVWMAIKAFLNTLGLEPGQQGLLLNGRLVGPIPPQTDLSIDDLSQLLDVERSSRIKPVLSAMDALGLQSIIDTPFTSSKLTSLVALSFVSDTPEGIFEETSTLRINAFNAWKSEHTAIEVGDASPASIHITVVLDPASQESQRWIPILSILAELDGVHLKLFLNPKEQLKEIPIKRFYRYVLESKPSFNADGSLRSAQAEFASVPREALLTVGMDVPSPWLVAPKESVYDLDNIKLSSIRDDVNAVYELEHIMIEGHSYEKRNGAAPRGTQLVLGTRRDPHSADTIVMANLGYFQFKANPGFYKISLKEGRSADVYSIDTLGLSGRGNARDDEVTEVALMSFQGVTLHPRLSRRPCQEAEDVLQPKAAQPTDLLSKGRKMAEKVLGIGKATPARAEQAEINIFSVASGHLYERMLNIMMVSVMKHTTHSVKFWFIEQFLSPSFKATIPTLAAVYGFEYEMVTYKWPHWLRAQHEKQREIWGYKILFLDVLFPLSLDKVIFVDADQIVRTDMRELVDVDLRGAPYGFTPMCDSRAEMEGFRFWKQGYWAGFLRGAPYHISALYVVDLRRFRAIAAGDRLRQQYHALSADPASLSNLDQDLPNHMQSVLPIHSLPQEWLWCETWCSDESLAGAKTIDLCNNPMTKEPKLDRARRQVPEWTAYDEEIAGVLGRGRGGKNAKSRTLEAETTHTKDEL